MNESYIGKIYLTVPYEDNFKVKKLGAKFNNQIKKWYFTGDVNQYTKFVKWIDSGIIASECIYILETMHRCKKCQKHTISVALGLGQCCNLFYDGDNDEIDFEVIKNDATEKIMPAWIQYEENIPPRLLEYLKEHYYVETRFSYKNHRTFVNFCKWCNAIQWDYIDFFINRKEQLFTLPVKTIEHYNIKMDRIRVKRIGIDSNLSLHWSFLGYEDCYINGKYYPSEDVIISNYGDKYITYEEMYNLV